MSGRSPVVLARARAGSQPARRYPAHLRHDEESDARDVAKVGKPA